MPRLPFRWLGSLAAIALCGPSAAESGIVRAAGIALCSSIPEALRVGKPVSVAFILDNSGRFHPRRPASAVSEANSDTACARTGRNFSMFRGNPWRRDR